MKLPKDWRTVTVKPAWVNDEAYALQPYVKLQKVLLARIGELAKGEVYDVDIRHDDDCPVLLRDGLCRCNPHVAIRLGDNVLQSALYSEVFR